LTLDHVTADTVVTITDLQAAGAEVLNIVSQGVTTAGNQNDIELGAESTSLKTINITGTSEMKLDLQASTTLTKAITIDATGLAAKAEISMSTNNTDATISTGSKVDTVTGGNGDDTISTGAGNDIINGTCGTDTITSGAGSDVIRLTDQNDNATDLMTITDFTAGTGGDQLEIDEDGVGGGSIVDSLSTTSANYVEGTVGAIGVNDSSTAFATARIIVVTDKSFANFDALDDELAIEANADIADYVAVYLDSTTGKAEVYLDDTTNTNTGEIHIATLSNITTLTGLADLVAANFDVI
jgi:Ca2+-binding RTX toxin-like protein